MEAFHQSAMEHAPRLVGGALLCKSVVAMCRLVFPAFALAAFFTAAAPLRAQIQCPGHQPPAGSEQIAKDISGSVTARAGWSENQYPLDLTGYKSGGTLAIVIALGKDKSAAGYFLLPSDVVKAADGGPSDQFRFRTESIQGDLPPGSPGSCTTLIYDFSKPQKVIFAVGGYWFSPVGSANTFEFSAYVRPVGGPTTQGAYGCTAKTGRTGTPKQPRAPITFKGGTILAKDNANTIQVRGPVTVTGFNKYTQKLLTLPLNGITITVKDKSAQFVQFFYRERIDKNGNHVSGWANQYSPVMSYAAGDAVVEQTLDLNGKPLFTPAGKRVSYGFTSLHDDNRGTPLPSALSGQDSPDWRLEQSVSCPNGKGCWMLETKPDDPTWILDGHAAGSPVYDPGNTLYGCDYDVTIFDTPNLIQGYGPEIWRFTAMDFVIVNHKIAWLVRWVKEKKPGPPNVEPTITATVTPAGSFPFPGLPDLLNGYIEYHNLAYPKDTVMLVDQYRNMILQ